MADVTGVNLDNTDGARTAAAAYNFGNIVAEIGDLYGEQVALNLLANLPTEMYGIAKSGYDMASSPVLSGAKITMKFSGE